MGTLLSTIVAADKLPDEKKLDLFLLVGQSNMAGRGKVEAQDTIADPRIWTLNKSGEWRPATDPLHFDKSTAGVGLGRTFAITVADKENAHIGLIPSAVGGTSINAWKKGGKLYTEALRRAAIAMKHGAIKGILWHQGEADSGGDGPKSYLTKLTQLIKDFREDLHAPDAPFICGQIGGFYAKKVPGCKTLNEILLGISTQDPRSGCVLSTGLVSIGDDTHFDAAGQRELGKRYAAEYLKIIGDKK